MQSLFMYILQSDNYLFLLHSFTSFYPALTASYFALPCVSSLYLVSHTTLFYHILQRSHYWSINPHLQVHWSCWFSDHAVIDTEKVIQSPPTEIRSPHHTRTDEFIYSSMESFLVQVKILSFVDSAASTKHVSVMEPHKQNTAVKCQERVS